RVYSLISIIKTGLWINAEAGVLAGVVSGVRTDDSHPHLERAVTTASSPQSGCDCAIESTVALIKVLLAPIIGESHFEANAILLIVGFADTVVHVTGDQTVFAHRVATVGQGPAGHCFSCRDGCRVKFEIQQRRTFCRRAGLGF